MSNAPNREPTTLELMQGVDDTTLAQVERLSIHVGEDTVMRLLKTAQKKRRGDVVDPAKNPADTVEFTPADRALLEIQELRAKVTDSADLIVGFTRFHEVVRQKADEIIVDENESQRDIRHAAIFGAVKEVLDTVADHMKNRVYKAIDVLNKAPEKIDAIIKRHTKKSTYDPQGKERQRQEHVTKKFK